MKIMLKLAIVCIFSVWTLSVQSLFRDLLLERVRHAFLKIREPIWVSSGVPFGGNGGGVDGYSFHVFFSKFQGPCQIPSPPCVAAD